MLSQILYISSNARFCRTGLETRPTVLAELTIGRSIRDDFLGGSGANIGRALYHDYYEVFESSAFRRNHESTLSVVSAGDLRVAADHVHAGLDHLIMDRCMLGLGVTDGHERRLGAATSCLARLRFCLGYRRSFIINLADRLSALRKLVTDDRFAGRRLVDWYRMGALAR